ncbi:hemicentin-1-like [Dermatophagoides farinae]|uniref:Hemicentin-1-like n=1 Tax=Dermatophagoides farinae TaxID=6954 RepID=A0A9D4SHU4_DERFA|nr:hemicentin-1-like [Dermatophagoides farinae]
MTKKMSSKYRQRINIVDYHDDQQIHLPSIELYGKRQQQQQQPQQIFSSPSPLSLLSIDDTKIQSTTMTTATATTKSLNSFLLNQNFHASSSVDNVNISSTATKNGDNEIVDKNSGYNCNGNCSPSSSSSLSDNHRINDDNINHPIITDNKLATIRFVRSYSEEFMSSSEERERGLQFFGGTSAGGSSVALSSSTTLLSSSSSLQSSTSSAQKRISPYFDTESISTNVTISEGSSFVHLPCRVKQLGDRTLSWIRRQDFQILTVGTFTYTSDQRFQAIHRENSDDWSLQISYPRKKDAGIYECQISTMPKMSLFIQLNVVVSRAKIVEGPTLYLSSGSTLNLTCMVKDTPEPPDYIFWYYNGQVINYGSPRGIKVHTEKSAQTISKLIILKAQANDSGNYSCTPSNAEPAHIAVHIQNNANPAASIQHGKRSAR